MSTIYPSITLKEVQWIIGHRESLTFDQLYDILKENVLEEAVDPIKESFQNLCSEGQDTIALATVLQVFRDLGTTGLSNEVMDGVYDLLLKNVSLKDVPAQVREQRKINLELFRKLCSFGHPDEDDAMVDEFNQAQVLKSSLTYDSGPVKL